MKSPIFNYIITIHNKESLIKSVLMSVIETAGPNSYIYPVLDGCTDATESIIDEIIENHPGVRIIKVLADDVHELKSINAGLSASAQEGYGFNIVLQDDVLLTEPGLESICIGLYKRFDRLGIVSFRHGGNISRALLSKAVLIDTVVDYVENECGHNPNPYTMLKTGYFTFKEIAIKSPICIPCHVVAKVGVPDEQYAPWDDMAYCYRVGAAGFLNGVLAVDFRSDVEWGTTRDKKQVVEISDVQKRNLKLFKMQFPVINRIDRRVYNNKRYLIFKGGKTYKNGFVHQLSVFLYQFIKKVKFQYKVMSLK
jgi:glycosyltransferase involved in cell wall biosynthesis